MQLELSKPPFCYWPESEVISYLQRRIIVYSIMYYDYGESCVTDSEYDYLSQMLVRMQKKAHHDVLIKSRYYYLFKDFDGTTGFYLKSKLNDDDLKRISIITSNVYHDYCNYKLKGEE